MPPEVRRDPWTGREAIQAPERGDRPGATGGQLAHLEVCPFCLGNEAQTPETLRNYPADSDEWKVRVFPNRYAAVASSVDRPAPPGTEWATGRHWLIIESPNHRTRWLEQSVEQTSLVFRAWADAISELYDRPETQAVIAFHNEGELAGASVPHLHSQLIACDFLPNGVAIRLDRQAAHFDTTGECLTCRAIADATGEGPIRVWRVPFARWPREQWLLPVRHEARFEQATDDEFTSLAENVLEVARGVELEFPGFHFNLVLQTSARDDHAGHHWHLEFIPRVTTVAGFELATDCNINPFPWQGNRE